MDIASLKACEIVTPQEAATIIGGKLLNEPGKTTYISWAKGIDMATVRPIENPNIRYETGQTEI